MDLNFRQRETGKQTQSNWIYKERYRNEINQKIVSVSNYYRMSVDRELGTDGYHPASLLDIYLFTPTYYVYV